MSACKANHEGLKSPPVRPHSCHSHLQGRHRGGDLRGAEGVSTRWPASCPSQLPAVPTYSVGHFVLSLSGCVGRCGSTRSAPRLPSQRDADREAFCPMTAVRGSCYSAVTPRWPEVCDCVGDGDTSQHTTSVCLCLLFRMQRGCRDALSHHFLSNVLGPLLSHSPSR